MLLVIPVAIIEGDTVTCASPTTVFTITHADPPFNWTVSSNLQIDTNNGNSITVSAPNNQTKDWGFVEVSYANGGMEHFDVWVGKPLAPESINGPEIVDTGAIVSYYGGVAPGATSYQWWLPYPFDIVTEIDYFGDNWQTWSNYTRFNSHVFTGYGQNNGLVQLMGVNKCGIGGAAIMYVEHGNCTGPGCGEIPFAPPNPVPNSSDESFSLDFSDYPEGTYYIYIYDRYSNIIYYGESNNAEKNS